MWFALAILSTLFYAWRRILEKRSAGNIDYFTLGWVVQAFSLPIITLLLFFTTIPNIFLLPSAFWIPLAIIWFILYPLQAYFYYRSLKEADISSVLPLMSFVPVFAVFFAWILLAENPTIFGWFGIVLIVLGVYLLSLKKEKSYFYPFRYIISHKPSIYMLINSMSLALGSTLDKIAIGVSNPLFYSFVNTLGATIILFVFAAKFNKRLISVVRHNFKGFFFIGVTQAFAFTFFMLALSVGLVGYVGAIKSSNVVIGSLLGIFLFKERANKNMLIAFVSILIGFFFLGMG